MRSELKPLSAAEENEVLGSSMSYYPSDLLVVGWMAAFVYDSDEGAAAFVLELMVVIILIIEIVFLFRGK